MKDETGALVIHCSDPRFQAAFQEFLTHKLGLERYALIAVPGGPQFLTLLDYLPKFSWAGWRWVKFLADQGHSARVVLIAHEDCRWYLDQRFAASATDVQARQLADLRQVCAGMRERFPAAHVELYYGRLAGGKPAIEPVA